ncbi:MAG: hypothetical protein R3292_03785 [Alcanivorax sp.]|nr:hypothetical protein [Alcanivorax sp.]
MKTLAALVIPLAWLASSQVLAQQDHPAAAMMAPAQVPMSEEKYAESQRDTAQRPPEKAVIKRFRQAFPAPGKPRIAVFWNRQFPARVSDWYSYYRNRLSAGGELAVTGKNARQEKGHGSLSTGQENRGELQQPDHNALALGLQSGLIAAFKRGGATVIDQAMAQRITDNALEDGTFERASPDQQRLQMRALARHADYVLELVVGSEFDRDGLYQVRVLSVQDASVVAVFSTDGKPPGSKDKHVWVVGDDGFEKRDPPQPMSVTGKEIALQTMASMSQ